MTLTVKDASEGYLVGLSGTAVIFLHIIADGVEYIHSCHIQIGSQLGIGGADASIDNGREDNQILGSTQHVITILVIGEGGLLIDAVGKCQSLLGSHRTIGVMTPHLIGSVVHLGKFLRVLIEDSLIGERAGHTAQVLGSPCHSHISGTALIYLLEEFRQAVDNLHHGFAIGSRLTGTDGLLQFLLEGTGIVGILNEISTVTVLKCLYRTSTVQIVLKYQSQLLLTLCCCAQVYQVEVTESHPVTFHTSALVSDTYFQRIAFLYLNSHIVGITVCTECDGTACGTLRNIYVTILHEYLVVRSHSCDVAVHLIDSILYLDGILYLGHGIVDILTQHHLACIERAVTIGTGTEGSIGLQHIHTCLEILHRLCHGEVAVPEFTCRHGTLHGLEHRIVGIGGLYGPAFASSIQIGIDHQVGDICSRLIVGSDGSRQQILHELSLCCYGGIIELTSAQDVTIRTMGEYLIGLLCGVEIIIQEGSLLTFEVVVEDVLNSILGLCHICLIECF